MNEGLPVVGFDWHGTLAHCFATKSEHWSSAKYLERWTAPRYVAIQRLQEADCVPVIITAATHSVRDIIERQVRKFTGMDLVVHTQEAWHGRDATIQYKAATIRSAGCHAHVGDEDVDRLAAEAAGVPFIDASMFCKYGLPEIQKVIA